MRPVDATIDHGSAPGGLLELACNVLANLERADPDVRPDRSDESAGVVGQRLDGLGHDPGNRSPPPGMHGGNVAGRRVGEKYGHAVGRPGGHRVAFRSRDESVSIRVGDRARHGGRCDFAHAIAVHLPLLKQAIERNA